MIALALGAALTAWAEPPEAPPVPEAQPDNEALLREIRALREEVAELRGALPPDAPDALDAPEPPDRPVAPDVVGGQRVGFGEPVYVAPDERVPEAVSFGEDVRVAGQVDGDAISFGGNVRIDGTGRVDGDAVSFGGVVDVADGGKLKGDRVAVGMPMSTPAVEVEALPDDEPAAVGNLRLTGDAHQLMQSLYRRLIWMLSVAGAGVLVVGLFPTRVSRVASDIEARPLRAAVVGTLATGFVTVFAALFAVLTLGLGSPVSLLLLGVLGVAWLLGFVGLCQVVGDRLPLQDRPHGRWLAFLVGVLLLTFLTSLPWVGWLVVVSAGAIGIGSALSTRFGRAAF
ncbi:MAG: hypothetical protein R3F59_11525 [Myxococcota bacterium]